MFDNSSIALRKCIRQLTIMIIITHDISKAPTLFSTAIVNFLLVGLLTAGIYTENKLSRFFFHVRFIVRINKRPAL